MRPLLPPALNEPSPAGSPSDLSPVGSAEPTSSIEGSVRLIQTTRNWCLRIGSPRALVATSFTRASPGSRLTTSARAQPFVLFTVASSTRGTRPVPDHSSTKNSTLTPSVASAGSHFTSRTCSPRQARYGTLVVWGSHRGGPAAPAGPAANAETTIATTTSRPARRRLALLIWFLLRGVGARAGRTRSAQPKSGAPASHRG